MGSIGFTGLAIQVLRKSSFGVLCLLAMIGLGEAVMQPSFLLAYSPQVDPPLAVVITDCRNDTQLRQAVTAAVTTTVTFQCGAGQYMIPIRERMVIAGNVTLDGSEQITLDGGGNHAFFTVTGVLRLRGLTLQNGSSEFFVTGLGVTEFYPLNNVGRLEIDNSRIQLHAVTPIYNLGESQLVVKSTSIMSNTARAIYNEQGTVRIESTIFTANSITGTTGTGGAIYSAFGGLQISNSTFRDNRADLNGGALYVGSGTTATLTNTFFMDNSAGYGGAIQSDSLQLTVEHSTFRGNRATVGDGGAIRHYGGELVVAYSTIRENQANTDGGGLSCSSTGLLLSHSTISGNQAGGNGGGIYSTCGLTITNVTISGNRAQNGRGGGIYQTGNRNGHVSATTIAENLALSGAGVYRGDVTSSSLTVHYTMLTNDPADNCAGPVNSSGYNLASDTSCSSFTQQGDQQGVNLPVGPLRNYGGPTETQLPLSGNPAIDAIPSNDYSFADDQRGIARPQETNCDIGSVEVGGQFSTMYLPLVLLH